MITDAHWVIIDQCKLFTHTLTDLTGTVLVLNAEASNSLPVDTPLCMQQRLAMRTVCECCLLGGVNHIDVQAQSVALH